MRLHAWSTVRRDIEFDVATASVRVIKLTAPRNDASSPVGFAHFERDYLGRRHVFALFRSGDDLFFCAGRRRLRLGQPELTFVHSRPFPFFSRFRIIESGRVSFSILYPHLGRLLFALINPTYDKIDEDSDFFLAFVAEYAQSPAWQADARNQWVSQAAA